MVACHTLKSAESKGMAGEGHRYAYHAPVLQAEPGMYGHSPSASGCCSERRGPVAASSMVVP